MKNKGLIITLIILLSIVIFFLVMFLAMYLKGGINFKNGIFSIGTKSTNIIYDNKFELEDIKNIDIKQDAGDILVKKSKDNNIKVVLYGENETDAQVELNNGNLTIDNTHNRRSFVFFNFGVKTSDIIIYLPTSFKNEIKVKNDYGKCEITDLENATVNIDCDAGDVKLGKIKNATLKCDYGNIEIEEIINKCNIKADCGNIKIDTIFIKENSTIKADLGNVDINNTNDIYIDADVNLGKASINKNNRNAETILKINCDCGNITVNN